MAKRGGVFQAMGNLARWTIWGLAGLGAFVLWLGWSNRANGPETPVLAGDVQVDGQVDVATGGEAPADANPVENAVSAVQGAVEGAVETAEAQDGGEDATDDAPGAPTDDERDTPDERRDADDLTEAEDATALPNREDDGVVTDEESDHNILRPELSEIRIPGDAAAYALLSAFRRDDGSIEVVSERVLGEARVQTVRLVQCAPLAVGVIAEGDGPRNDAPALERIPLGSAAATIAALACGAMN